MLILQCAEASRINQKCIINSSGKPGYIISIYLFSTCVWDGSPKRNRGLCVSFPPGHRESVRGSAQPRMCADGQDTGPSFLFDITGAPLSARHYEQARVLCGQRACSSWHFDSLQENWHFRQQINLTRLVECDYEMCCRVQ